VRRVTHVRKIAWPRSSRSNRPRSSPSARRDAPLSVAARGRPVELISGRIVTCERDRRVRAYLPYFRLDRKAIGESLGAPAGAGTRSVASYDEDSTSMAVEAARAAMRAAPDVRPGAVYFATATPAYLDKTNASAIHAALALDAQASAFDMVGLGALGPPEPCGRRSTPSGRRCRARRHPRPACRAVTESRGGDGAVAFLLAISTRGLAEPVRGPPATAEFLERLAPAVTGLRQWRSVR